MTKRPSARWRLARIEEFLTRAHGEIDAMSDEGRHISARLRGCSITIGLMIDSGDTWYNTIILTATGWVTSCHAGIEGASDPGNNIYVEANCN